MIVQEVTFVETEAKDPPKFFNVRLTRVESTNDNLRTREVVGIARRLPTVGEGFVMFAEAINPEADGRMIVTSDVRVWLAQRNEWRFWTENSEYHLTIEEVA